MVCLLLHHPSFNVVPAQVIDEEDLDEEEFVIMEVPGSSIPSSNPGVYDATIPVNNIHNHYQAPNQMDPQEQDSVFESEDAATNQPPTKSLDLEGAGSGGDKTCRISIVLVCLMLLIGLAVSILGAFMSMLGSVGHRDCVIWAGVPLAVTGIIGIYYCGHEFEAYSSSTRAFVVKCACLCLACTSCCICTVACVFTAVHTSRILSFLPCRSQPFLYCACFMRPDPLAQLYIYPNTPDCAAINDALWRYSLSQCVMTGVGSIITLWFVLMLWKSRYHGFYAGLKFYSYSANSSSHHPSLSM